MITRWLAFATVLCACSGDETRGSVDANVVLDSEVQADSADSATVEETTSAPDTVADTGTVEDTEDTSVATETSEPDSATDIAPEVLEEVIAQTCGNGVVEGTEACDDGDDCAADGCAECAFEPAVVLVELALDPTVGWDLDDADGDHDVATGIDNRMAATDVVRAAVNGYISDYIASGELVQLAALGGVDSLADDAEVQLALFGGRDVVCPPSEPPPWLDGTDTELLREPADFVQCVATTLVDDGADVDNGIHGEAAAHAPAPPWLRSWVPVLDLPVGPLGTLRVARARFEAHLAVLDGVLTGLDDGRLGGVIPAAALARIDTSDLLPLCPTALHAVLGLAGHIDQDAEANGAKDFILWTAGAGIPCITTSVTISGCCDDGACASPIAGADCVFDARIGDGFSAGFRVSANAVHVLGPAPVDTCVP